MSSDIDNYFNATIVVDRVLLAGPPQSLVIASNYAMLME